VVVGGAVDGARRSLVWRVLQLLAACKHGLHLAPRDVDELRKSRHACWRQLNSVYAVHHTRSAHKTTCVKYIALSARMPEDIGEESKGKASLPSLF